MRGNSVRGLNQSNAVRVSGKFEGVVWEDGEVEQR